MALGRSEELRWILTGSCQVHNAVLAVLELLKTWRTVVCYPPPSCVISATFPYPGSLGPVSGAGRTFLSHMYAGGSVLCTVLNSVHQSRTAQLIMQNWWQIRVEYKALCVSKSLSKLIHHNLPVLVCYVQMCSVCYVQMFAADVFCCVVVLITLPDQV